MENIKEGDKVKFGIGKESDPKAKCPSCNANVSEVPRSDRFFFCPFCGESLKRKYVILSTNRSKIKITVDPISPSGREDFRFIFPESVLSYISRRHFKFTEENGEVCIEDIGSANGTLLNGREIRGGGLFAIKKGDNIDLGGRLRVTVEGIEFESI